MLIIITHLCPGDLLVMCSFKSLWKQPNFHSHYEAISRQTFGIKLLDCPKLPLLMTKAPNKLKMAHFTNICGTEKILCNIMETNRKCVHHDKTQQERITI